MFARPLRLVLQTTLCVPLLVYDWITVIRYFKEHQRQTLLSCPAHRTQLHELWQVRASSKVELQSLGDCTVTSNQVKNYVHGRFINLQGTIINRPARVSSDAPAVGRTYSRPTIVSKSTYRILDGIRTAFASRAFRCENQAIWNSLPPDVIDALVSNWVTRTMMLLL